MVHKHFITISTCCLLLLLSQIGHAKSFGQFETWSKNTKYHRGNIVTEGYDIFVGVLPSINKSPSDYKILWRKVRYDHYREFKEKKIYLIGSVVQYEDRYYFSSRINIPMSSDELSDSDKWVEFSHPGMNHDMPDITDPNEEPNDIVGTDSNGNGIRDDFEVAMLFSDLSPDVIESALAAGKVYGELVQVVVSPETITKDEAITIVEHFIFAKQCQDQLQAMGENIWRESDYFNSFDRIETKFKLLNMLADLVDDDDAYDIDKPDPCNRLIM